MPFEKMFLVVFVECSVIPLKWWHSKVIKEVQTIR